MKKLVILILILLIIAFVGELIRERLAFTEATRALQKSYWQIDQERYNRVGLNVAQLRAQLGVPVSETPSTEIKNATRALVWTTEARQGALWRALHLNREKDFYKLMVYADDTGRVIDVLGAGE